MRNAERIVTPTPYVSNKWSLPPMGWLAVYTLAALLFGALACTQGR